MSKAIIDLGKVMPIKGQDYYTDEEVDEVASEIAGNWETSINNNFEDTSHKVTEINSTSTDTEYPSAKAVYNSSKELDNRLTKLNTNCQAFKLTMPNETAEGSVVSLQNCNPVPLNSFEIKGVSGGSVTGDNTVKVQGKNWLDKMASLNYKSTGISKSIDANGDIVISSASASSNRYAEYKIDYRQSLAGKVIRFIATWTNSASNKGAIILRINGTAVKINVASGSLQTYAVPNDTTNTTFGFDLYANYNGTLAAGDYVTYSDVIITIDDEDMTYEEYQEKTQLLSLGTTELLENDIIHKDNFDWKINDTKITDITLLGQLEALEELPLFEGINNIFTVTENTSPILKVNANKKWNLDTLEARITLLE